MDIGEKIKNARLERGMTQEELGKILGVQKSAIAKYESGRVVNIKRSTLKKISDVLDLRPSELIFEANREEIEKNNDIITDAVIKMRTDSDFLSLVECLMKLDSTKQSAIKQMALALQK
jgi:transcriptional regulator with XRE-family HTH domain